MTLTREENFRRFGLDNREALNMMSWNEEVWNDRFSKERAAAAIGLLAVQAPVLPASATCGETQALLLQRPQEACVVICDSRQKPSGLLMSESFYIQMNAEYEPEHLYDQQIGRIMNLDPLVVDFGTPITSVREQANSRPSRTRKDTIIVTHENRFFGVVQVENLPE